MLIIHNFRKIKQIRFLLNCTKKINICNLAYLWFQMYKNIRKHLWLYILSFSQPGDFLRINFTHLNNKRYIGMWGRIKWGEKKYTEKTQVFDGNSSRQEDDFQNDNKHSSPIAQGCSNLMHSGEPPVSFNIKLYMQLICNRTLKSQWRQTW